MNRAHPSRNRGGTMTRRVAEVVWCAVLLGAMIASTFSQAATKENEKYEATSHLLKLVAAQFPNLTEAERALLVFVDLKQSAQGDFALAGPSAAASDATNDPAHADLWNYERDVRAELIRWLSVDPDASRLVDPRGIRLLGARVTGRLDLSRVHVPFPIVLRNCAVPELLTFAATNILSLDLGGSLSAHWTPPGSRLIATSGSTLVFRPQAKSTSPKRESAAHCSPPATSRAQQSMPICSIRKTSSGGRSTGCRCAWGAAWFSAMYISTAASNQRLHYRRRPHPRWKFC